MEVMDPETGELTDVDVPAEPELAEPELEADAEPELEADAGPDLEVEPPQVATDAAAERAFKALDRKVKNYRDGVAAFVTDTEQPLFTCPMCLDFAPGYIFDPSIRGVDEAKLPEVRNVIGLPSLENFKQPEFVFACDTCGGLGQIATGSKVNGHMSIKCQSCDGKGWGSTSPVNSGPPAAPAVYLVPPNEQAPDEPRPQTDPWGRTATDPLYGVMPGFERS